MVHLAPPILVVASPLLRYICAVRIAAHGDDHPIPVVGLEAEQVVLQAAHKKNMTLLQLLNLFFRMCAD